MGTRELPALSLLLASQAACPKRPVVAMATWHSILWGSWGEGPASWLRLTLAPVFILLPHLTHPLSLWQWEPAEPHPDPASASGLSITQKYSSGNSVGLTREGQGG